MEPVSGCLTSASINASSVRLKKKKNEEGKVDQFLKCVLMKCKNEPNRGHRKFICASSLSSMSSHKKVHLPVRLTRERIKLKDSQHVSLCPSLASSSSLYTCWSSHLTPLVSPSMNIKSCNIQLVLCLLVILQLSSMCPQLSAFTLPQSSSLTSSLSHSNSIPVAVVSLPANRTANIADLTSFSSTSSSSSSHHHRSRQLLESSSNTSVVNFFNTFNSTINFTHVVYDRRSDRIYVGASNWLYQFNSNNLRLEFALPTGPVADSPWCSPSDCSGVSSRSLTANFNKVLVIDENSNKLIVCGSVHQGACRRHSLEDITQKEDLVPLPVAANDENSSTYAFIGPSKYYGRPNMPVLFVGATHSRLGPYRGIVPAIASRSLESGPKLFDVVENSFSDIALVDIESHLKDYYLVKYVYGFYTEDFIYFATVQKKSHLRTLEELGYVTRLARICASDAAYNTYTEVTLTCLGPDGTDYTLMQDAVTVSAGQSLANDLHVAVGSKVLIAVFSTSKDHTWKPSDRSAVCVYSVEDIEQKFNENIHLCYNGSTLTRNMDYIAGNIKDCPEPGSGNVASFCSETLKLNGSIPIVGGSAAVFDGETLTAVSGVIVGQQNIAFIGTSHGRVKKVILSKVHHGEQVEEVVVDDGHPILADMSVDKSERYIYVASPYRLAKVAIQRCNESGSCKQDLPINTINKFISKPSERGIENHMSALQNSPPKTHNLYVMSYSFDSITIGWNDDDESDSQTYDHRSYIICYKPETDQEWTKFEIGNVRTREYKIVNLKCGTKYIIYMIAKNSQGIGEPSKTIPARTMGRAPVSPSSINRFTYINTTWIQLNLGKWQDSGCPIHSFTIRYKLWSNRQWMHNEKPATSSSKSFIIENLIPGQRYNLIVSASSDAGITEAEFDFETHNNSLRYSLSVGQSKSGGSVLMSQASTSSSQYFRRYLTILLPVLASILVGIALFAVILFCLRKHNILSPNNMETSAFDRISCNSNMNSKCDSAADGVPVISDYQCVSKSVIYLLNTFENEGRSSLTYYSSPPHKIPANNSATIRSNSNGNHHEYAEPFMIMGSNSALNDQYGCGMVSHDERVNYQPQHQPYPGIKKNNFIWPSPPN